MSLYLWCRVSCQASLGVGMPSTSWGCSWATYQLYTWPPGSRGCWEVWSTSSLDHQGNIVTSGDDCLLALLVSHQHGLQTIYCDQNITCLKML